MTVSIENQTMTLLRGLRSEMRAAFDQVDERFDRTDSLLDGIEQRLKTVGHRIIRLRQGEAGAA